MKRMLSIVVLVLLTNICFALKPDTTYRITPDSMGLNYTEQIVKTSDNALLNTWVLNVSYERDNGTTIILNYGDGGNMSYWLGQAAIFNKIGYTVVLFDYRGFGHSSDFKIDPDQLYYNEFATDLMTIIKWTKQNIDYKKLGVLSFSMGTIMTTIALQTEKVDFFVGEGFIHDPVAIKERLFKLKQSKVILPENSESFVDLLPKINIPILVFSGTEDKVTTTEDSELIVAQKSNRELVTYKGNHLGGFGALSGEFYGQEYMNDVAGFIKKYCK